MVAALANGVAVLRTGILGSRWGTADCSLRWRRRP